MKNKIIKYKSEQKKYNWKETNSGWYIGWVIPLGSWYKELEHYVYWDCEYFFILAIYWYFFVVRYLAYIQWELLL